MYSLHVGRASFCLGNNFQYTVPIECVTEKSSHLLLANCDDLGMLFIETLRFRSLINPCTSECLVLSPYVCYFSQQA